MSDKEKMIPNQFMKKKTKIEKYNNYNYLYVNR